MTKISMSFSPFSYLRVLNTERNNCGLLIVTFLLLFHVTEAYLSVSVNSACKHTGTKFIRLSPETAVTLILDSSNGIHRKCRIEVAAPETHSISLLFVRRTTRDGRKAEGKKVEGKKVEGKKGEDTGYGSGMPKCSLLVSIPILRGEEVKMGLDLCSEEAFKSVEPYADLLPSRMTLEWIPNGMKNSNEILVPEIVVAAVGRGREFCSRSDQFPCKRLGYPVYCISKELVCDGKRNCPIDGKDEDEKICNSDENNEKNGFVSDDSRRVGRGWEFLATEFLKKLTSKEDVGPVVKSDSSTSTDKSNILWTESGSLQPTDSESLPDVLKQYGPWGYLMLGMLICGTVLMFCGLWECCCRRPKSLVSNAVGPALLIINQGSQQNEIEIPSTPEPPRYEELDQPPSYETLFPLPKSENPNSPTTNSLPITLPIVESLSNFLINNNSRSQINSTSGAVQSRGSATSHAGVFAIEMHNNGDASRDGNDRESILK